MRSVVRSDPEQAENWQDGSELPSSSATARGQNTPRSPPNRKNHPLLVGAYSGSGS